MEVARAERKIYVHYAANDVADLDGLGSGGRISALEKLTLDQLGRFVTLFLRRSNTKEGTASTAETEAALTIDS